MKKIIKNYKQSIILIGSLIIGTIVGLVFKEKATVLEPLGTLFINMLCGFILFYQIFIF